MVKKASRAKAAAPTTAAQREADALAALESHGERFMAMFDDDHDSRRAAKTAKAKQQRSQPKPKLAGGPVAAAAATTPVLQESSHSRPQLAAHQPTPPSSTPGASTKKRPARPLDEVEEILFTQRKAPRSLSGPHSVGSPATGGDLTPASIGPDMKQARRLFMSSKAGKVHATPEDGSLATGGGGMAAGDPAEEELHLGPQDLQALRFEVERLGASQMDRKQRKAWQAAMLQRLGARPEKRPRTSARIGLGMAAAAKKRAAKQLEQAIESGMVKRKGLGKKKRADKERSRDKGLLELGSGFKGGVLYVGSKKGKRGATSPRGTRPGGKAGGKGGGKRRKGMDFGF